MADRGTSKKVTRVDGGDTSSGSGTRTFVPTEDSKSRATRFRIIAIVCWVLAIGFEAGAIYILLKRPDLANMMVWVIGLTVVDMVFAIIGSMLWKKSNRLDPASEKEPVKFFIQNQLGAFISIIAFLPLVIVVLTNKNLDKKQKAILGGVAGVALVIAAVAGIDFNPPSVEQYAEQTARVEDLTGRNFVYWTKSGTKYHVYSDCHAINKDVTDEIFEGTVARARELKNITELCNFCEKRAEKEKVATLKNATGTDKEDTAGEKEDDKE
ncbi:MAG TPA: hypothetical protein PK307_14355 [Spirochaetota bacterium]|nr:hypothetical protein [Spirochaetota bacterium]HOD14992.1 hypothetical protein [Spirochaetota bacterium]HPG49504.1 hypothetical protein [Spirochaetota bacterium]HPN11533.1 hypothetical protein [Spirochaetota bacterium]HQL83382.1 hypothetical protein [Spirochaetota bacterium]